MIKGIQNKTLFVSLWGSEFANEDQFFSRFGIGSGSVIPRGSDSDPGHLHPALNLWLKHARMHKDMKVPCGDDEREGEKEWDGGRVVQAEDAGVDGYCVRLD